MVMLEQIKVINKNKLIKKISYLLDNQMIPITKMISISLDILNKISQMYDSQLS